MPQPQTRPNPSPKPRPKPDSEPSLPAAPKRQTSPIPLNDLVRNGASGSLATLAAFLPPTDRALVVGYLSRAQPTKELAALAGLSTKAVRARLRRLITRLNSPRFKFVAANLDKWPGPRRDVACALFLHGLTMKDTAKLLGITRNRVLEHRTATLAVLDQLKPL